MRIGKLRKKGTLQQGYLPHVLACGKVSYCTHFEE
jgi:hypothetical protein